MLRRANRDDADELASLHRASISALCRDHYTREQIDEWIAPLQPSLYRTLVGTRTIFVVEDSMLAGFGVCDPGSGLVHATYVSPTAIGRGVGRQLVLAMEAALRSTGESRAITLNATLNAVGFYEKLGYASGKRAMNYLPSGAALPCVVMTKR